MNKSFYGGLLGGIVAAVAVALWQRWLQENASPAPDRGEVIFSNTPQPTGE